MTFRQFTFHNVLRNKRLYAAYFLSSMFSVLIFFVFAIFAFHPLLTADSLNDSVAKGLYVAEGIIYFFSFFFVLYSMSSFLKSRQKEFGMLVMHGMTSIQLRTMIFWENMLIGLFSTLGGLGLGMVFSKAILLAAENVLQLDQTLQFYMPTTALLLTFGAFIALFAVISVFTVFMIRNKQIIELLKGNAKPRPEPKASILLSLLGAVLLAAGYITSIAVKGMIVVLVFIPVTIAVIIGTYLLFSQLSVFTINWLKRRQRFFWRGTNMITLSDLAYRMKDNARTFFIVAIVSTVAFCAIGALFGFKGIMTRSMEQGHPYTLEYKSSEGNDKQDQHIAHIEESLAQASLAYDSYEASVKYYLTKSSHNVPIVAVSEYNTLAEVQDMPMLSLAGDQAIVLFSGNYLQQQMQSQLLEPVALANPGVTLQVTERQEASPLPDLINPVYVVGDDMYTQLTKPERVENYFMWNFNDKDKEVELGKALTEELNRDRSKAWLHAKTYAIKALLQGYYIILFIGLFIGVIFFVAAGSFLYFRLFNDLDDDKRKFASIAKLGLSPGELSNIITRQTLILFFAPVGVALVHGIVALTALQNMFMSSIFNESAAVLGSFLGIQIIYFAIVRFYYAQSIKRACNL
ncbi:ABC transporter permease [Paenibacillaceae bacterium]|nr:ABC transporter permease [Paenibacillaceae bacterium]